MKTPILALALSLAMTATVCAQARYVTLIADPAVTNSVSIASREFAELVSFPYLGFVNLDVLKDGRTFTFNNDSVNQYAGNKGFIVAGPAIFRVRSAGNPGLCTLKITPESFPPDKTVIIPEGVTGATITMECSTDLINWSTATNGFYTGTNSAKFFRIHAERAP